MSDLVEQVARALQERFKEVVAIDAGTSFEKTKVSLPHTQVWEGYARAAISAMIEAFSHTTSSAYDLAVDEMMAALEEK